MFSADVQISAKDANTRCPICNHLMERHIGFYNPLTEDYTGVRPCAEPIRDYPYPRLCYCSYTIDCIAEENCIAEET